MILIYINNIILAGDSMQEFDFIKHKLDRNFKIKDFWLLRYFLGLEIVHSRQGVFLSQRQYCLNILGDTGFLGSKLAQTLATMGLKLTNDGGGAYHNLASYRRLIGRLLYLTTA